MALGGSVLNQNDRAGKNWGFGESLQELHFAVDAYLERARASCSENQGRLYVLRQKWFRYCYFLTVVLNRFQEAERLLGEALHANSSDPLEMGYFAELRTTRSNDLLLEVESFYLFSKILLDRIADAIAFVFDWKFKGHGSSHAALCKELEQLAADRHLLLPPGFAELPAALYQKIVEVRNGLIDHARDFGPIAIRFEAPGASGIRRMEDGYATQKSVGGAQETGDLYRLVNEINDYMMAVVTLLRSNMNRVRV